MLWFVEFCRKLFVDKIKKPEYNETNLFKRKSQKNDKNHNICFNIFIRKKMDNQKIIQKNQNK